MNKPLKLAAYLLATAALAGALLVLLYSGTIRLNYLSRLEFPIQGIDVSHHQGQINWPQVAQQAIQFAFIKATEGGDFKDKQFQNNWDQARAVGIDVGAYHFFTFCRTGLQQAKNFIDTVPNISDALPPVIDLEFGGNCQLKISDQAVLFEIDQLQQRLTQVYGKRPIFYATPEFYNRFLINRFPDNPIWIRNIFSKPSLPDQRQWLFWQFANRGHLNGIQGPVDLNVFNGSTADYQHFKTTATP